jgi:hypothetical protein
LVFMVMVYAKVVIRVVKTVHIVINYCLYIWWRFFCPLQNTDMINEKSLQTSPLKKAYSAENHWYLNGNHQRKQVKTEHSQTHTENR